MKEFETAKKYNLEELAKRATSFYDFAQLLADVLEMDKRKEIFVSLELASIEVKRISWENLEKALKRRKVVHSRWDLIWISGEVTKKIGRYSTILPLLEEIRKFENYPFLKDGRM